MNDYQKTRSIHPTIGCSLNKNHVRIDKDYYATNPEAVLDLIRRIRFKSNIWECACGGGHVSRKLEAEGYSVYSSDIEDRGAGHVADFFSFDKMPIEDCDIITNPPFNCAEEFVRHAIALLNDGAKAAFLLRLLFLEGKKRKLLFESHPPKYILVYSYRISCYPNGIITQKPTNAIAFAWFVWEKGYKGSPILKWI